jgi:hypothetical protein
LKIRKEEENLKNTRQKRANLSSCKNIDGHISFAKTMIEDDFKEIGELKRKYEILKLLDMEYNDYIKEIKEINKDKKKTVKEINLKENKLKNNNIKIEQNKMKKMIKISKKENYHKNRYNYLKIRKEEENLKNKRQKWANLSSNKKIDGHNSFAKTMIEDDFKEIGELKRKYEILKLLNKEYNDYMKEIKEYGAKKNTKRTFTPLSFNRFMRKYISYNIIEPTSRQIISSETPVEKCRNKLLNRNPFYKNNNSSLIT